MPGSLLGSEHVCSCKCPKSSRLPRGVVLPRERRVVGRFWGSGHLMPLRPWALTSPALAAPLLTLFSATDADVNGSERAETEDGAAAGSPPQNSVTWPLHDSHDEEGLCDGGKSPEIRGHPFLVSPALFSGGWTGSPAHPQAPTRGTGLHGEQCPGGLLALQEQTLVSIQTHRRRQNDGCDWKRWYGACKRWRVREEPWTCFSRFRHFYQIQGWQRKASYVGHLLWDFLFKYQPVKFLLCKSFWAFILLLINIISPGPSP